MATLAEMERIDCYAEMLIEASRFDPALRGALSRRAPLYEPIDHYHCSCCGRIVISKGTSKLSDLPLRWLGSAVNIIKSTWQNLKQRANDAARTLFRFKSGNIQEAKARICSLWLTFASSDETLSEAAPFFGSSYQNVGTQERMERLPHRNKESNRWKSLGKSSGLQSTMGELVRSTEPLKLVQSDIEPEASVKESEYVQSEVPIVGVEIVIDKRIKYHEEDAAKHTSKVLVQEATSPLPYTQQKFWKASSNPTPIRHRTTKPKPRNKSLSHSPSPISPTAEDNSPLNPPLETPPTLIPISLTSKETLTRLFTSDPKNKKLLHFDAIVAALEDAGLTAKRGGKCSGSAVTFKHREGRGSIVFHCPHPEPKVEFHKQRTWGTRLQNKFGWELETFVVKGV